MHFRAVKRYFSTATLSKLKINDKAFVPDDFSNVRSKILEHLNRNLYLQDGHPLSFVRQRIVNYFYDNFKGRTGNSFFSVHDRLDPIVSTQQNFDSLLIPKDHVSRRKSDCYYINKDTLLRSHMTAHQSELILSGLNSFLMVGDVYRRDEIDQTHYPVFHQLDGVRLFSPQELFAETDDGATELIINKKEQSSKRTEDCQEMYTVDASKEVEKNLKIALEGLVKCLFGSAISYKWTSAYFPFTHPSWELEVEVNNKYCEVLGCGVIEHGILENVGCKDRIGWAFGLGLERLAMILYKIPDIRLFWSTDSGFISQFESKAFTDAITYRPISQYPQCRNDMSFWITESFSRNDFYDLVRDIGGDYVEQIYLRDEFTHPKTGKISHCYSIVYRHMEKTLTQEEVNNIHNRIAEEAKTKLKVEIR